MLRILNIFVGIPSRTSSVARCLLVYRYVRETDVITGTLRLSIIISGIDAELYVSRVEC
jgi:hypothetical protein